MNGADDQKKLAGELRESPPEVFRDELKVHRGDYLSYWRQVAAK